MAEDQTSDPDAPAEVGDDTAGPATDPAVDTRRWPVVVVVIDQTVEGDRIEAVTAALDDVLRRRERIGVVFDYGRGPMEAQQRISMWLAERVDALRVLVPAAVTVVAPERLDHIRSMIDSGMFTMPFESWATATVDDGVAWVSERLPSTD
ncbi:MAG: hypothetical protein U0Q07_18060 [Acidimicrobiales bacterium]